MTVSRMTSCVDRVSENCSVDESHSYEEEGGGSEDDGGGGSTPVLGGRFDYASYV